ncbi:MAG: hypothetical protein D6731_17310 [Planctomycetota bacterium]|nr:MAG: hypothetical protein D6731_17310 [Planctomycetota bacterium]
MRSLYGGETGTEDGATWERASPAVGKCFRAAAGAPITPLPAAPERAALLPLALDEATEVLRCPESVEDRPALTEVDDRAAALDALARAAGALAAVHARERPHGDLRPETIRGVGSRCALVVPARAVSAPRLLRARLAAGADPVAVAYAAPEVVCGEGASPASDVYSLAACAARVLNGRPPLGRTALGAATKGLGASLGPILSRALDPDPAARPPLDELQQALAEGARRAAEGGDFVLVPDAAAAPRGRVLQTNGAKARPLPAEPGASAPPGSRPSALLFLVLAVAASFVFCGALGLVVTGWEALGTVGQLGVLGLLTASIGVGGVRLERRGFSRSGFACVLLASQLLGVDGAYFVYRTGQQDEPLAWAAVAIAMALVDVLLAWRRDSELFGALAGLSWFAAVVCGWQACDADPWTHPLLAVGYGAVAAAIGAGLALVTAHAVPRVAAVSASLAGSAVLWAQCGAAVATGEVVGGHPVLGWLGPYAFAGGLGLLAWLGRPPLRALFAGGGALLLVWAPSAQATVFLGEGGRPTTWMAAAACVALVGAGLAFAAERLWPKHRGLGVPYGLLAVVWTQIGAGSAVFALAEGNTLYAAVPYALAAGLAFAAWRAREPLRWAFVVGCGLLLLWVPTAQAAAVEGHLVSLFGCAGLGLALLWAAFAWPRAAVTAARQVPLVGLGLVNALCAPLVFALVRCADRDGWKLLEEAVSSGGRVHETRFVFLSMPLGIALALVALGIHFSRDAERKLPYRMVEGAGLLAYFGLLTVLSFAHPVRDTFYVFLLLAGGALALGAGLRLRRAMLVWVAGPALLLTLVVQYFAKLSQVAPFGLVAVGFGLLLLGAAVLYERKLKQLLGETKGWA